MIWECWVEYDYWWDKVEEKNSEIQLQIDGISGDEDTNIH